MSERKLGGFLSKVIHWQWDEFCRAETDPKYSGAEASVLSLVRICAEGDLRAIKMAIDRVDGKVVTPVQIEYPKIYTVYPYAKERAPLPPGVTPPPQLAEPQQAAEAKDTRPPKLASMSLQETLMEMSSAPRQLPEIIKEQRRAVEEIIAADYSLEGEKIPLVKSVIAANLLLLSQSGARGSLEAIDEVFDRIDGKLVETIKVLGGDMCITSYAEIAPYDAVKDENGVYRTEYIQATDVWRSRLEMVYGDRGKASS